MKVFSSGIAALLFVFGTLEARTIGINVLLSAAPTGSVLQDLARHGTVVKTFGDIKAVSMRADSSDLRTIRAKPYVVSANQDVERKGSPLDTVPVADFTGGLNTWNLDAVNVTNFGGGRTVAETGRGVYVAVLDTGLHDSWRQYFPEQRIAGNYAKAFRGGGGEAGNVSEPTNMWEHDQNGHGTHVTSTVLGFSLRGTPVGGVAPQATVIPVKVLGQNGSGWSSVIAEGIVYIANLKRGPLAGSPVVINMSLGGPELDAVEQAAIDYAIAQGVIIVAAAGNEGAAGMSYPGAYAPVISVAASGWTGQWSKANWWNTADVPEPTRAADAYIADFSSRARAGQDLDIAAPGSWVVGPYQVNSGQTSYYYNSGTSMASPHVAGIVALMAQKDPSLSAFRAEMILEDSAIPLTAGCRTIMDPDVGSMQICWGSDATGRGLATADAALKKLGR
ncbi:MAG TPA: S8 family serine peptidase [Bryobacteraceae bacterium]|nr:S8 family serine peptidase [Bryobacteraceae bacterium]